MPKEFAYYEPEIVRPGDQLSGVSCTSRSIGNVRRAFSKIALAGDRLSFWCHKSFPTQEYAEYEVEAGTGKRNHFQGIQRTNMGSYAVLSGCSRETSTSHLFVAALPSRHARHPWRSNCLIAERPQGADEVLLTIGLNRSKILKERFSLDERHWHAGGMATAGDVLAVPIEGGKPSDGSKILFFDLSKPDAPKIFNSCIDRRDKMSGAASLLGNSKDSMLAGVYYSDGGRPKIDFYVFSKSSLVSDVQLPSWTFDCSGCLALPGLSPVFGEYQSIQFLAQADGKIFLVGFHNLGMSGFLGEPDVADLYELSFWEDSSTIDDPTKFDLKTMIKIATIQFRSDFKWFDMDAGAGIYVDPFGGISVHACYGFKQRKTTKTYTINFVEFRPITSDFNPSNITTIDDAWIDLFEDVNCHGRCIGLVGKDNTFLANMSEVRVNGDMMNNQISSVRFQLPVGSVFTLFDGPGYTGRSLDLVGSGFVTTLSDLRIRDFGDKASSGRFTKT